LFWCTKKIENVLERCVRSREEFQNKEKRRRWSKFTGNFADVRRHLRIGELECKQPGGDSARDLGRRYAQNREVLIGARGETNSEQNRQINSHDFLCLGLILSKTWGRRLASMLASFVGPTCQSRKEEEGVPVWERGKWATDCFYCWAGVMPRSLFYIFLVKTIFPFSVLFETFCK
jgi:hypothetical protein